MDRKPREDYQQPFKKNPNHQGNNSSNYNNPPNDYNQPIYNQPEYPAQNNHPNRNSNYNEF